MKKSDLPLAPNDGYFGLIGHNIGPILDTAEDVLAVLLPMIPPEVGKPPRTGGVLTILHPCGRRLGQNPIGWLQDDDDSERYYKFSREKADRLHEWYIREGHTSSAQSALLLLKKFPGAIWTYHGVLSFSGLPATADWALCLAVAVIIGWMPLEAAMGIAERDGDEYFSCLAKALGL